MELISVNFSQSGWKETSSLSTFDFNQEENDSWYLMGLNSYRISNLPGREWGNGELEHSGAVAEDASTPHGADPDTWSAALQLPSRHRRSQAFGSQPRKYFRLQFELMNHWTFIDDSIFGNSVIYITMCWSDLFWLEYSILCCKYIDINLLNVKQL